MRRQDAGWDPLGGDCRLCTSSTSLHIDGRAVPTNGSNDSIPIASFARIGIFPESQGINRHNRFRVAIKLAIQVSLD